MNTNNVIQLFPAPAAAANTNSTAAVGELAIGAPATTAGSLARAGAHAGAVASMWAPLAPLSAGTDQQLTHAGAAVAQHGTTIAHTNDQALAATAATDEQNREELTLQPAPGWFSV